MKFARICTAILFALTFATVCAAQGGPPAKAEATGTTESMIISNEKMVGDAIVKNDQAGFSKLVSMDAWVVSSRGSAKVSDIIQSMFSSNVKTTSYTMEGAKVMMLNPDTAVITYKSVWAGTENGKEMSETSYDSTLWVKRDGKWWAIFHQSSEVAKPATTSTPSQ